MTPDEELKVKDLQATIDDLRETLAMISAMDDLEEIRALLDAIVHTV
jgi:hypothetical protein